MPQLGARPRRTLQAGNVPAERDRRSNKRHMNMTSDTLTREDIGTFADRGIVLGDAYKPTPGKGVMRQASGHVWADPQDSLPAFLFNFDGQGQGLPVWTGEHPYSRIDGRLAMQGWLPYTAIDGVSIGQALQSAYTPAGPLLQAAQGQLLLAMATRQAGKLVAKMDSVKGAHKTSDATRQDSIGAGVLAVCQSRAMVGPRLPESMASVCWRAIVREVSTIDLYADTMEQLPFDPQGRVDYDSLTATALPLPQLTGDATRQDKAARLLFERARAKRPAKLARRIETLKAGANAKRQAALDKVHNAALYLLAGDSLEVAAVKAGYKASGQGRQTVRACDRLVEQARRMGWQFLFNLRQVDKGQGQADRRGAFEPLAQSTIDAMTFNPSASLRDACNGRGSKQRIPLITRLRRQAKRQAALQAKRASWQAKLAKLQAKRQAMARAGARVAKLTGRQGSIADNARQAGKLTSGQMATWLKFQVGPEAV
jgi:hypothetical protein